LALIDPTRYQDLRRDREGPNKKSEAPLLPDAGRRLPGQDKSVHANSTERGALGEVFLARADAPGNRFEVHWPDHADDAQRQASGKLCSRRDKKSTKGRKVDMTVSELIARLEEFPPELPVFFSPDEAARIAISPRNVVLNLTHAGQGELLPRMPPSPTVPEGFVDSVVIYPRTVREEVDWPRVVTESPTDAALSGLPLLLDRRDDEGPSGRRQTLSRKDVRVGRLGQA
jgi:hypothetical protein